MEQRNFFSDQKVSALSLGGGGIGQVWGLTTREEAVATTREAVDCQINWIDVAPGYGDGEAERVVGEAFNGILPGGVRVSTKCKLPSGAMTPFADRLAESLEMSLDRMRLASVDLLMLHNVIFDPDTDLSETGCTLTDYLEQILPSFVESKREGTIAAWGITGIGVPSAILRALAFDLKPQAVQIITNALDSAGDIQGFDGDFSARDTLSAARQNEVAVMGIRAVQAGALTEGFDRPVEDASRDMQDYVRASGFRTLSRHLGLNPAILAHRYALSMKGVATVVLGVKNRRELYECLEAELAGALDEDIMTLVDQAVRIDL